MSVKHSNRYKADRPGVPLDIITDGCEIGKGNCTEIIESESMDEYDPKEITYRRFIFYRMPSKDSTITAHTWTKNNSKEMLNTLSMYQATINITGNSDTLRPHEVW